ncbi:MAG: flagellar biosynthesis protein FlhB [Thermoleophilaceae bacterium]|nr:flagellar biosynthesis protein FlhB [Thermoleophilaceae bacterium]
MAEKTEKPTPKRRDEAKRKGNVARSADLNGAVVTIAGLLALSAFGPKVLNSLRESMTSGLLLIANPDVVSREGVGAVLGGAFSAVGASVAPIAAVCALAGVGINWYQVRPRLNLSLLKPDPKRIDPRNGLKTLLSPRGAFEGGKSVVKVAVVGAIAATAVLPHMSELGGVVGMPPQELLSELTSRVFEIAKRAAAAYLVIAIADYFWQRRQHEKSLRMDRHEVKEEAKSQQLPPEVRGALRRRQMEQARARMMAAVPEADVVVTNPTHFAVALRYDGTKPAPEVVAKGPDLIAFRIRRIAEEHGVPVIEDPPLARALHASVEVGQMIPEELYQAVAQLLAFVYRVAGRRAV